MSFFHFSFLAEVDQFSVDAVARSAPAVLIQKTAPVNPESGVLSQQFKKLRDDNLDERRDCEGVVHASLGVAHPHLQCVEEWVQPNIPPDFSCVIDATSFDQQLAVIFIL